MLKYVSYDIVFREIPDETTLAVNISNCPNNCAGCHSPWLQNDEGKPLTDEALKGLLARYANAITCLCFMGGDAEPKEVERLAQTVNDATKGRMKVGWYSGRSEIPSGISVTNFRYIKLGGYIEEFGALTSRTTNQRLYEIVDGNMCDITDRFQK